MRRLTSPVVIGRAAELRELGLAYERAADGHPSTIVIGGEAGVGKTRLVAALAERVHESGGAVLRGACVELAQGTLPYAPFVEALRSLSQRLAADRLGEVVGPRGAAFARLMPGLYPDGRADRADLDQAPVLESVLAVLGRLGEVQPTVLVLEDLHWADVSTLDLLTFIARNLSTERSLVVATYRTDERGRQPVRERLVELERSGAAETIELGRFSEDEVRALVTAITGAQPVASDVSRLHARSDGNAFYCEELIDAGALRGAVDLSPTLEEVLGARVRRLSPPARALLRFVAVAQRPVDLALVATVSGTGEEKVVELVREALAHHILVVDRQTGEELYRFRHALLGESIYRDLLAPERRRLHAALAEAIAAGASSHSSRAGSTEGELAHHWFEAARWPEALVASVDAASAAMRTYGYPEALAHYERAIELSDRVPEAADLVGRDRVGLLREAARAACRTNDEQRAIGLLRAALTELADDADRERAGLVHAELVGHLDVLGDLEGSARAVREGMRLVPSEPPSLALWLLTRGRAWTAFTDGRYAACRDAAVEAVRIAERIGATKEIGEGKDPLVFGATFAGDVEMGLKTATDRLRSAEADSDAFRTAMAWYEVGFVLQADRRWDDAAAAFLQGADVATRNALEMAWGAELELSAAEALRRAGRWSEATELARRVVVRGGPYAAGAHQVLAILLCAMGELDEAEHHAEAVLPALGRPVNWKDHAYYPATTDIALMRRRYDDARAAVDRGLANLVPPNDVRWTGELVVRGLRVEAEVAQTARALRSSAHIDRARQRATGLLDRIRAVANEAKDTGSIFSPESDAPVLLAEAEWTRLEGRSDPAAWAGAAAAWRALKQPYQEAYASYRQAEALLERREGRRSVASIVGDARSIAQRVGATTLLQEIDALTRRAGLALPTDEPARAPEFESAQTGPVDQLAIYRLTAREREVLHLVAEGRTDAEIGRTLFISPKTVSVHVSNIKAKLGVSTRVQAATLATRVNGAGIVDLPMEWSVR